jgi:hypothetical protein
MADADMSAHSKAKPKYESEHALRGCVDGDLFLVRDLESLRICVSDDEDPFGTNRVPVPFQTGKAKAGALAVAMLQNSARSCFRPNEKLGAR